MPCLIDFSIFVYFFQLVFVLIAWLWFFVTLIVGVSSKICFVTVILDLDETLIYCSNNISRPDKKISVAVGNGQISIVGLNVRPFAYDLLRHASLRFEVIIFTASTKNYADTILDILDPSGSLISHRVYRENTLLLNGLRVKDLSLLKGRSLSNTVIVDNSVYSFGKQLDNGIPIKSWHDDREDNELLKLMNYLKEMDKYDDVRELNRRTFGLQRAYEVYNRKSIL